jgi:hypothetical protein
MVTSNGSNIVPRQHIAANVYVAWAVDDVAGCEDCVETLRSETPKRPVQALMLGVDVADDSNPPKRTGHHDPRS